MLIGIVTDVSEGLDSSIFSVLVYCVSLLQYDVACKASYPGRLESSGPILKDV